MKAWHIRSYGGPQVLELGEVPEPEPGPGDVLIDIRAASVNPIDWKLRQGMLKPILKLPFPIILGSDLAGEVIAVGGESLNKAFQVVRPGGMVLSISGVPEPEFAREWHLGAPLRAVIWLMSWSTRRRARKRDITYRYLFMHPSGEQLATLAGLIDDGVIKPVVDRTFPFEAADQAMAYAEKGHATGKVVITRQPAD